MRSTQAFLWEQPAAEFRLRMMRTTLGIVGTVSMAALPSTEFIRAHRSDLAQLGHAGPGLPTACYPWLKAAGLVFGVSSAACGSAKLSLLAALTTGSASHTSASMFRRLWTYDTHVPALLLLAAVPMPASATDRRRRESLVLALMQGLVGGVYGHAALSKIRNDPAGWLRTGDTLRASIAIMGTPLGRRLLDRPVVFGVLSAASVVLEAAVPVAALLGGPTAQRWVGAAALAFHGSTAATLKIPFWHLAALLPGLFIHRNRSAEAGTRAVRRIANRRRNR